MWQIDRNRDIIWLILWSLLIQEPSTPSQLIQHHYALSSWSWSSFKVQHWVKHYNCHTVTIQKEPKRPNDVPRAYHQRVQFRKSEKELQDRIWSMRISLAKQYSTIIVLSLPGSPRLQVFAHFERSPSTFWQKENYRKFGNKTFSKPYKLGK